MDKLGKVAAIEFAVGGLAMVGKGLWLLAFCAAPACAFAGPEINMTAARDAPIAAASYKVDAPASHGSLPSGWGLYATMHGRSTQLTSPQLDWTADPTVQPRDIEAGYGWRSGRTTALLGYEQHDFGPRETRAIAPGERDPNEPPPVSSSGVLGLSFVLHAR